MKISLKNVGYEYLTFENNKNGIYDVSLEIDSHKRIAIVGHTGSGKSTLLKLIKGLLKKQRGQINIDGKIEDIGYIFQYPEHQLFEIDVLSDVCFGPLNQGLSKEEAIERAKSALTLVGLDESFYKKSPFELSGGQKRRVAIAGVLAMNPEVLILDEPTAGLDPKGREEILGKISELRKSRNITIILVSHSMEDVAKYADKILVLSKGELVLNGTPKEVFRHIDLLESIGLRAPEVSYIIRELREKGFEINEDISTIEEARDAILALVRRKNND